LNQGSHRRGKGDKKKRGREQGDKTGNLLVQNVFRYMYYWQGINILDISFPLPPALVKGKI
jgi:hypothetical protein